ncbi:hypothetical protein Trydic_g22766 [Trypoxylus dichotomus]
MGTKVRRNQFGNRQISGRRNREKREERATVRKMASALNVAKRSIHLHHYKLQLVQELKPTLFSNEMHFHLNNRINVTVPDLIAENSTVESGPIETAWAALSRPVPCLDGVGFHVVRCETLSSERRGSVGGGSAREFSGIEPVALRHCLVLRSGIPETHSSSEQLTVPKEREDSPDATNIHSPFKAMGQLFGRSNVREKELRRYLRTSSSHRGGDL